MRLDIRHEIRDEIRTTEIRTEIRDRDKGREELLRKGEDTHLRSMLPYLVFLFLFTWLHQRPEEMKRRGRWEERRGEMTLLDGSDPVHRDVHTLHIDVHINVHIHTSTDPDISWHTPDKPLMNPDISSTNPDNTPNGDGNDLRWLTTTYRLRITIYSVEYTI